MDVKELAREERADLADLLAALSPEEWDAPTLCARWRVRDVVAHLVSYEDVDARELVRRFVRGRLIPDRVNAVGLAESALRTPEDLLAFLREHLEPHGLTTGFGGRIALLDAMVHHQDIRRPLGRPRQIPAERLRPALSFAMVAPPIKGFWRTRGLRLAATDLDWAGGRGRLVEGPAEALLLAIAGRPGVADQLTGPGQPVLAARIDG
jgi:uncharacterized protein (TIGR03083 family)